MYTSHIDIAREIKSRNNKTYLGIVVGVVEQINPLIISILNKQVLFYDKDLFVCKNLTEYQIPFILSSPDGEVSGTIIHEGLKLNDKIACMTTEDNSKLFLIDKVV